MLPLAAGLMVGGGLLSAYGQYQQSQYQGDLMDFNAQQTALDAAIARQNAQAEAQFIRTQGTATAMQAREEAQMLRKEGKRLTARQRTRYAKSGLRMEGTPLEVMAETIENIEIDAIAKRQKGLYQKELADWQATLTERSGAFSASQMMTKAGFMRSQAGDIRKAGTIGAIGSMIGTGAGAAGMFA